MRLGFTGFNFLPVGRGEDDLGERLSREGYPRSMSDALNASLGELATIGSGRNRPREPEPGYPRKSGRSRIRSHVPSGCRRATCARVPASSLAAVAVRARSPRRSVGSGSSRLKWTSCESSRPYTARFASCPTVICPGGKARTASCSSWSRAPRNYRYLCGWIVSPRPSMATNSRAAGLACPPAWCSSAGTGSRSGSAVEGLEHRPRLRVRG